MAVQVLLPEISCPPGRRSGVRLPGPICPPTRILPCPLAARAAHTAHVYELPPYWEQGDGDRGDAFVEYFHLTGLEVVIHRTPSGPVSVDPVGNLSR